MPLLSSTNSDNEFRKQNANGGKGWFSLVLETYPGNLLFNFSM